MDIKPELLKAWDNNKEKLILFIHNKIGNKKIEEDILQEVFVKYWEGNSTIKEKSKILNWLYSVTRYTIADYYREKERNKIIPLLSVFEVCNKQENETINPDESRKLQPIIQSLPAKYRNILMLSDIYGLDHKVISEKLNLSLSCVKQRVLRAKKMLGERMNECCNFSYDKYGNIVTCTEKPPYLELIKNLKKNF